MRREPMHGPVPPAASGTNSGSPVNKEQGLTARPGSCLQSKQHSNLGTEKSTAWDSHCSR